jgi:hypothetical protein
MEDSYTTSDCVACRVHCVKHLRQMPEGRAVLCLACQMPEDGAWQAQAIREMDGLNLVLHGLCAFGVRAEIEQLPLGAEPFIPPSGSLLVRGHVGLGGPPVWRVHTPQTGHWPLAWVRRAPHGARLILSRIMGLDHNLERVARIRVYDRRFEVDSPRFLSACIEYRSGGQMEVGG